MKYAYLGEFVFQNENGRIHTNVISECVRNKSIQVGIDVKSIHSIRRTINSKMKCMGVSTTIASSILGHTEEVNENNYTYDITNSDYKLDIFSKINENIMTIANEI